MADPAASPALSAGLPTPRQHLERFGAELIQLIEDRDAAHVRLVRDAEERARLWEGRYYRMNAARKAAYDRLAESRWLVSEARFFREKAPTSPGWERRAAAWLEGAAVLAAPANRPRGEALSHEPTFSCEHGNPDDHCRKCVEAQLVERLRDFCQSFEDLLSAALTDSDADGFISAYHFKAGAIHWLLGKVRQWSPPGVIQTSGRPTDPTKGTDQFGPEQSLGVMTTQRLADGAEPLIHVVCYMCNAKGPIAASPERAVAAWNRRLQPVTVESDLFGLWGFGPHFKFQPVTVTGPTCETCGGTKVVGIRTVPLPSETTEGPCHTCTRATSPGTAHGPGCERVTHPNSAHPCNCETGSHGTAPTTESGAASALIGAVSAWMGRWTLPIGPDKTPREVVICGTVLTAEQVSVLRELIRDACATSGDVPRGGGFEGFVRTCRELYQIVKLLP